MRPLRTAPFAFLLILLVGCVGTKLEDKYGLKMDQEPLSNNYEVILTDMSFGPPRDSSPIKQPTLYGYYNSQQESLYALGSSWRSEEALLGNSPTLIFRATSEIDKEKMRKAVAGLINARCFYINLAKIANCIEDAEGIRATKMIIRWPSSVVSSLQGSSRINVYNEICLIVRYDDSSLRESANSALMYPVAIFRDLTAASPTPLNTVPPHFADEKAALQILYEIGKSPLPVNTIRAINASLAQKKCIELEELVVLEWIYTPIVFPAQQFAIKNWLQCKQNAGATDLPVSP